MVLKPEVQPIWPFSLFTLVCVPTYSKCPTLSIRNATEVSKRLNCFLESLNDDSILQISFCQCKHFVQQSEGGKGCCQGERRTFSRSLLFLHEVLDVTYPIGNVKLLDNPFPTGQPNLYSSDGFQVVRWDSRQIIFIFNFKNFPFRNSIFVWHFPGSGWEPQHRLC